MQLPSSLSALVFLLFVELPSRQAVLKGTNNEINNGRKREPCSWSELANKRWGSGDLPWSFYFANCFFFFPFSLVLVGDAITSFYPLKGKRC